MTLLEGLQVLLPHGPVAPWTGVELPGPIHRQPGRFVLHNQPLDTIDIRQALAEVVRVAPEDCLYIRLVVLQEEGAGTDGGLDFFEVAILLPDFGSDDP